MLSLEPILPPDNYEFYEKECFEYLVNNDIDENDIYFLKSVYESEGIKFCIETFNSFSLEELKKDLEKKNTNFFKNIILFTKCLFIKLIK